MQFGFCRFGLIRDFYKVESKSMTRPSEGAEFMELLESPRFRQAKESCDSYWMRHVTREKLQRRFVPRTQSDRCTKAATSCALLSRMR